MIAVDGDPTGRDAAERMLAAAADVSRQHIPDGDGWCAGCLDLWARLAPFPCLQAQWAAATQAEYTRIPDDTRDVAGD